MNIFDNSTLASNLIFPTNFTKTECFLNVFGRSFINTVVSVGTEAESRRRIEYAKKRKILRQKKRSKRQKKNKLISYT